MRLGGNIYSNASQATDNPVDSLHKLCAKKRLSKPTFSTNVVVVVNIVCTVGQLIQIGSGGSKKVAKREAANKMMDKLKGLGSAKEKVFKVFSVWLQEIYLQIKTDSSLYFC